MAGTPEEDDADEAGLFRRATERLVDRGWMVAASVAVILAVNGTAGGSAWAAVLGCSAILVVSFVAPGVAGRRRHAPRQASDIATGRDLTAVDLAAAVADPLVVYDGNGIVLHANPAALAAFGPIAAGSPIELKFRAPEMQDLIARSRIPGSATISIDYAERVPLERWYRVAATRVGNGSDLVVLNFRDQSETRRIDRMRADFIANASHELRTPLASVAGFIETLRGPARNDPAARETFLQIMQGQTSRMARLIDDLLSLSRLEMKAYLKPGETVDVANVVASVIDTLSHLAAESGVSIERHLPVGTVEVAGNRDELIQVFENLLENAIKYGQSGQRVVVRLEGGPAAGEREVRVSIQDFGPGIPREHIPRVTERFYRVDVESSRAQKGTGLGLAIVKHILTRHNGRLAIRSGDGKGASFTVHLPLPAN